MNDRERIKRAGEYLAIEYAAKRPLDIMRQDFAPRFEAEAYAIQDAFQSFMTTARGPAVGYKIAYTNAIMRERSGVNAPCSGRILSEGALDSPATVQRSDFVRLGVECEVAVKMASGLPASGAPYSREDISDAVEWLAVSFEIIDGRPAADAEGQDPALKAIVTNISNAGAVLGEPVADWRDIDLPTSRGSLVVNGDLIGEGVGSDVLGHPVEPVAWLANNLADMGQSLEAGAIILTGSFVLPYMLDAGDVAVVAIDGLGEARLDVS
ncbi:MAG: fumarylacetoacetate hydrolase family protein [Dehalococcoidia bacterium]|nr:fumarylacetoacetate hydrolase family protein [Dehalococcoidia bacterium]